MTSSSFLPTFPANIQAVLDDLADGASLERACKPAGRPCKSTVLRKAKADPEIAAAYSEALECRAEHRVEQLDGLNAMILAGTIEPQSARVLGDNLKWLAGKDSARFSERQRIEATGKDGAPLIPEPKPVDLFEEARYISSILWRAGIKSADQMNPAALIEASTR